ncbi:hypothetical protein FEM48_Zijuj11G0008300 [Ziziphus jujuba var. spinosa]|uniref:Uncharacterized protein n=1 Tax=Ziziphus jujuba var. spinosa TaxID=714518 RepID=A0A978UFW3_ZIZJJ|nr:hypothetical protein FEM48_Zijuj11G0008300 [Ziziphus jujuba var. spinosa]
MGNSCLEGVLEDCSNSQNSYRFRGERRFGSKCMSEDAAETKTAKKSLFAASELVESLLNGLALKVLEVLLSRGNGVWRVNLMIDTEQLEEIFQSKET